MENLANDYEPIWNGYNKHSQDPEYVIASTVFKQKETLIFESNAEGRIVTHDDYGGSAERWGMEDWDDVDFTVKTVMGPDYKLVELLYRDENCSQSLYKKFTTQWLDDNIVL